MGSRVRPIDCITEVLSVFCIGCRGYVYPLSLNPRTNNYKNSCVITNKGPVSEKKKKVAH
jgi:hypothetical protein